MAIHYKLSDKLIYEELIINGVTLVKAYILDEGDKVIRIDYLMIKRDRIQSISDSKYLELIDKNLVTDHLPKH